MLGSLFFVIYINDTCCSSRILKFILFADDTNLFHSSKSIDDLKQVLNHEMAALSEWFNTRSYRHAVYYRETIQSSRLHWLRTCCITYKQTLIDVY